MDGGELINVLGRMASGGAVEEREERTESRDAGEQNLLRRSQLIISFNAKEQHTPMFSSMTPQSTNIVELPVLAIAVIWYMRKIEHTVVRSPSKKTPQRTTFFLASILRLSRSGIGRKKMNTSKKIETAARP